MMERSATKPSRKSRLAPERGPGRPGCPSRRENGAARPAGGPPKRETSILGIPIDNVTMDEALGAVLERVHGEGRSRVCFVNADCANIAFRDSVYRRCIEEADFVFADGIGLKIAGRILGREIRDNVNGTDLFPLLAAELEGMDRGIYLLGARPGVAEGVRDWIAARHPGTKVCGCRDGYFAAAEEAEVIRGIRESGAALLLAAMGAPRQDLWIQRNLAATGVKVAMGVGGLFDFYSGRIPRAPRWVREIGLEWLYRFSREPRRMWRRYILGNPLFLARVLMEKGRGRLPWEARKKD